MLLVNRKACCNSKISRWLSELFAAERMRTVLLSFAFVVWVLSHILQESIFADTSSMMVKALRAIAFVGLLCVEAGRFSDYKSEDWILAVLLLPFAISGIVSHNTVLFQGLVFCYCARRDINIEVVLKCLLVAVVGALLSIILLSQVGIVDSGDISVSMGGGTRLRSSLGFSWPSRAPNYFLTVVLVFILLFSHVKKWQRLIAVVALCSVNLLIFEATDSRTPAFLVFVAIAGFVALGKARGVPTKRLVQCLSLAFIVCMACLILVTLFYTPDSELFVRINALLSGRLRYSQTGIENYPLTLFGSNQVNLGDPLIEGYFDSGYLRMLYTWGIIPSLIFMAGITYTLWITLRRGDYALSFVLVLLAVHSTIEGRLVLLYYSPFLIYMGPIAYEAISRGVVKHTSTRSEKS